MIATRDVLAQLGTVKNPVLFTSSFFSASSMYFSHDFVLSGAHMVAIITGAVMIFCAVVIFLVALVFYMYAFLKLPSSTQELVFLQEAKAQIDHHRAGVNRSRAKKASRNA